MSWEKDHKRSKKTQMRPNDWPWKRNISDFLPRPFHLQTNPPTQPVIWPWLVSSLIWLPPLPPCFPRSQDLVLRYLEATVLLEQTERAGWSREDMQCEGGVIWVFWLEKIHEFADLDWEFLCQLLDWGRFKAFCDLQGQRKESFHQALEWSSI